MAIMSKLYGNERVGKANGLDQAYIFSTLLAIRKSWSAT